MIISDVIEHLKQVKKGEGDIEVFVGDHDGEKCCQLVGGLGMMTPEGKVFILTCLHAVSQLQKAGQIEQVIKTKSEGNPNN